MEKNKFLIFYCNSFFYAAITFLSLSLIAKNLDVLYYGQLATILTICNLFLPFVTLKVDQLWLKEIDENENDFKFAFYLRRIIYNFIFIIIPLFVLFKYISNSFMASMMTIYFFSLICYELMNTYSMKRRNYAWINNINFSTSVLRILLFSIVLLSFTNRGNLFLAAFVFPVFFYSLIFVKKILQTEKNKKKFTFQFKKAAPFFLAAILASIYNQTDILMLSIIKGDEATAGYHVSFTCLMAIYFLPSGLFQKFLLPRFHELANESIKNLKKIIVSNQLKILMISILVFLLTLILSKPLILFFFGIQYEESIKFLRILAIGIPFYYMAFLYGAYLTTQNFLKKKIRYMYTTAILNIILNLVFIPLYGAMGASYSTIISVFCLSFLYFNGFKKL